MKELLKRMTYALLWAWQIPQNVAGIIVQKHYERKADKTGAEWFYSCRHGILYLRTDSLAKGKAVALGEYVVVNRFASNKVLSHEFGHVRQSRMLGPLYLPLIGLQSLCHAAVHYDLCGKKKYKPYNHFWTEQWADRLGGVRR